MESHKELLMNFVEFDEQYIMNIINKYTDYNKMNEKMFFIELEKSMKYFNLRNNEKDKYRIKFPNNKSWILPPYVIFNLIIDQSPLITIFHRNDSRIIDFSDENIDDDLIIFIFLFYYMNVGKSIDNRYPFIIKDEYIVDVFLFETKTINIFMKYKYFGNVIIDKINNNTSHKYGLDINYYDINIDKIELLLKL